MLFRQAQVYTRGNATQRETPVPVSRLLDVESPPACHDLDSKRFENKRFVQLFPKLAPQTLPRLRCQLGYFRAGLVCRPVPMSSPS